MIGGQENFQAMKKLQCKLSLKQRQQERGRGFLPIMDNIVLNIGKGQILTS